jgi:hypothetical protein
LDDGKKVEKSRVCGLGWKSTLFMKDVNINKIYNNRTFIKRLSLERPQNDPARSQNQTQNPTQRK